MQLHYAIKLCATNKNRKISREPNNTLFTEQQHLVQISNDISLAFVALFQAFFFPPMTELSNSGLNFGFSTLIKFQLLGGHNQDSAW